MALYEVHFVDHGNNVFSTAYIDHANHQAAIAAAHQMNVPSR